MTMPLVADYMARRLITLAPDQNINHAMNLLLDEKISGAPVVDDEGWLRGVLSKKDCLRAAIDSSYHRAWNGLVSDYMAPDPVTLNAGRTILEAAKLFAETPYRRFPVLEGGALVGQLSRADALRAMRNLW
ncbi:CBS domain protein [Hoeflea halophila]|uniref:CBS domain protein n=1 Tax=Hoeflea halophila TaxID=714899 RepID=A0A286IDN1_9HYPH|nr:CBS domain-containing protein [Hoeflea halophila]SOE18230.1 CBS domain protein [Hoeflea halophila]